VGEGFLCVCWRKKKGAIEEVVVILFFGLPTRDEVGKEGEEITGLVSLGGEGWGWTGWVWGSAPRDRFFPMGGGGEVGVDGGVGGCFSRKRGDLRMDSRIWTSHNSGRHDRACPGKKKRGKDRWTRAKDKECPGSTAPDLLITTSKNEERVKETSNVLKKIRPALDKTNGCGSDNRGPSRAGQLSNWRGWSSEERKVVARLPAVTKDLHQFVKARRRAERKNPSRPRANVRKERRMAKKNKGRKKRKKKKEGKSSKENSASFFKAHYGTSRKRDLY